MTRYEQLALEISGPIQQGVFRPGERVPSVRRASELHRVNPGTVLRAFAELEARGLIEARPQSGYYVRARALGLAPEPAASSPRPGSTKVDVSSLIVKVLNAIRDPAIVRLGSAFPSPELFP